MENNVPNRPERFYLFHDQRGFVWFFYREMNLTCKTFRLRYWNVGSTSVHFQEEGWDRF